jgi:phospholipase C
MMKRGRLLGAAFSLLSSGAMAQQAPALDPRLAGIDHIVVVYLENHSFDNLYGNLPGVEGLSHAGATEIQVNDIGLPFQTLPPVLDNKKNPPVPDSRFTLDLPNSPFSLTHYLQPGDTTSDLVHRFYQEQLEIDGGQMDKYVLYGGAGGLPMGYYDGDSLPMAGYARQFTIGDNMFHAAFGGSFLNHFWLVCACTPIFPNAPDDLKASVTATGDIVKDGAVTPDGYAVNTLEPAGGPHHASVDAAHLLPLQSMPTIGDRLNEKGISWAWYAGGYNAAITGHADKLFEVHHQPFLYFANYALGSQGAKDHLGDETDLIAAINADTLPAVSFWKPIGEDDEHPGYTNVARGDQHAAQMIELLQKSPDWKHTLVIVTYDENGGEWDHVPPPKGDRWGPGTRVPLMVISPMAKYGFVDHTVYDTTSILALIEHRFGLAPLTDRDAHANPMLNALTTDNSVQIPIPAVALVPVQVSPAQVQPSAPKTIQIAPTQNAAPAAH